MQLIVDTSGAYIPGHGTPTILVFGRNRAPEGNGSTAVLGKRGEPSNPPDPAKGKVWSAIEQGWDQPGFDSPWVSTERVSRQQFAVHPWSLRGGGALALQGVVENNNAAIASMWDSSGFGAIMGEDHAFIQPLDRALPSGRLQTRPLVVGECVRDWGIAIQAKVLYPYDHQFNPKQDSEYPDALIRLKSLLGSRRTFSKETYIQAGRHWADYHQFSKRRLSDEMSIGFAFVSTHNHFVLDRGGKVFKQSAPVIKLPATATVDDHLALLGPLNSSTACFWMKQVFYPKGGDKVGSGGRLSKADWMDRYEHDSTKLARFPLPPDRDATLPYARALDQLGQARAADPVALTLADERWSTAAQLRDLLDARRARDLDRLFTMVGIQDELDWLCYRLYGIIDSALPVLSPDDTPSVQPGMRPFELDLALADATAREAIAAGLDSDEVPTAWFERHGWTAQTTLPADADPTWAALVTQRRQATAASAHLRLLEAPVHKRRWYRPDFDKDEHSALQTFLLNQIEDVLSGQDEPQTPRALARILGDRPRFHAAAELFTGAIAPELDALVASLMAGDSVPAHPLHRYTKKGLVKRKAWETTWALQEREDRGEAVKIKVPPKYTGADFLSGDVYKLRGPLDVPKERFVHFSEVPTATGSPRTGPDALYGWAGWSRAERLDRLSGLLEELDDEGVPTEERTALFDTMFRYIRELARTDAADASDRRADLRFQAQGVPEDGPTTVQLAAWLKAHPAKGDWA